MFILLSYCSQQNVPLYLSSHRQNSLQVYIIHTAMNTIMSTPHSDVYTGNFRTAHDLYMDALQMFIQIYGPLHLNVANCYRSVERRQCQVVWSFGTYISQMLPCVVHVYSRKDDLEVTSGPFPHVSSYHPSLLSPQSSLYFSHFFSILSLLLSIFSFSSLPPSPFICVFYQLPQTSGQDQLHDRRGNGGPQLPTQSRASLRACPRSGPPRDSLLLHQPRHLLPQYRPDIGGTEADVPRSVPADDDVWGGSSRGGHVRL